MKTTAEYVAPTTLGEALEILANTQYPKVLAGGCALVLLLRNHLIEPPEVLVDIKRIQELHSLDLSETGEWMYIGSACTHSDVESHPLVQEKLPALSEMASRIGTMQVRNRGTIGGNLCHADPASDPPTLLLALEARVSLVSRRGRRVVPLEEFLPTYYGANVEKDELLESIMVPCGTADVGVAYVKYSSRTATDMCMLGVAAYVALDSDERFNEVRVAVGNGHVRPVRLRTVEEFLKGERATESILIEASGIAPGELDPVSDFRGSRSYRLAIAPVLVERAVRKALSLAGRSRMR